MAGYNFASATEIERICAEKGITSIIGTTTDDPADCISSKARAFTPTEFEFEYIGKYDESTMEGSSTSEISNRMALEAGAAGFSGLFSASADLKMKSNGFSAASTYFAHKKVSYICRTYKLKQWPLPIASSNEELVRWLREADPKSLFERYGPVVIKGVQIGGLADSYFTTTDSTVTSASQLECKIDAAYGKVISGSVSGERGHEQKEHSSSLTMQSSIRGGDLSVYKPQVPLKEQTEWFATLMQNPVRVKYIVAPIWDLLPFEDMERIKALKAFAEQLGQPVLEPVLDFYSHNNRGFTFHMGDPWPDERKKNIQFYAYRDPFPGTQPVFSFWHSGLKEYTFHMGTPWPGEERKDIQFYAFPNQLPGTEPVYDFWNTKYKQHTFHMGKPWGSNEEEKRDIQFYAYRCAKGS